LEEDFNKYLLIDVGEGEEHLHQQAEFFLITFYLNKRRSRWKI